MKFTKNTKNFLRNKTFRRKKLSILATWVKLAGHKFVTKITKFDFIIGGAGKKMKFRILGILRFLPPSIRLAPWRPPWAQQPSSSTQQSPPGELSNPRISLQILVMYTPSQKSLAYLKINANINGRETIPRFKIAAKLFLLI